MTLPLYGGDAGERLDVLKCVKRLEVGQAGSWPARVLIKAKRASDAPQDIIVGRLRAARKSGAAA